MTPLSPTPETVPASVSGARSVARAARPTRVSHRRAAADAHVLSEPLFRDALVRERRRADRFEVPFVLVLIALKRQAAWHARSVRVIEDLSRGHLDADVIGWFEQDSVIGVIRSLGRGDATDAAGALAATVYNELLRCLTPGNADCCSITLEVYSPHGEQIAPVVADAARARITWRHAVRHTAKRLIDVAGSTTLLVAFSPVFLAVSAFVKITSAGPVFFRQQRIGRAGEPFMMLKFRTMHVNADSRLHQEYVEHFIDGDLSATSQAANVVFKIVDDPRVTPIGHFLRRSSLDEIPQFWNVLKGEMSLVGPRPPLPYEVAKYKRWHQRRVLEATPGITGLWQVTGRSRTTFDEMVRLDLRYARTHSVWADLKILLATPKAMFSGKGAH